MNLSNSFTVACDKNSNAGITVNGQSVLANYFICKWCGLVATCGLVADAGLVATVCYHVGCFRDMLFFGTDCQTISDIPITNVLEGVFVTNAMSNIFE